MMSTLMTFIEIASYLVFNYLRSDLIPALARLQVHDLAHADFRYRATSKL